MKADPELYIQRQIVRRWKSEANNSTDLVAVFSPYLTSKTADTVLLAVSRRSRCEVHTIFEPEVFVTGASSIRTLKRLAVAGIPLFSLTDLHAKVIVVPGQFASIGSQNITAGGTTRLEANVATADAEKVDAIWREVKPWMKERKPITVEMIEDMERLTRPLIRRMKKLRRAMDGVTKEVETNEANRRRERERREQEAKQREAEREAKRRKFYDLRRRTTRVWDEAIPKSQRIIYAHVVPNEGRWKKYSLKPVSTGNMTSWRLDNGETVHFPRLRFCVCMIHGKWTLAFVRVGKGIISFVENSVRRTGHHEIAGVRCTLAFNTDYSSWSDEESDGPNLFCDLGLAGLRGSLTIPCWFHLDGIEMFDPTIKPGYSSTEESLRTWFTSNSSEIARHLIDNFTAPFRYSDGSLDSYSARSFFGDAWTRYRLEAAKVAGHPILVARKRE